MHYIVENKFTGYRAVIMPHRQMPAASTIRRHLRRAKAKDCCSITTITDMNGARYEAADLGDGLELHRIG